MTKTYAVPVLTIYTQRSIVLVTAESLEEAKQLAKNPELSEFDWNDINISQEVTGEPEECDDAFDVEAEQ
jgi:hypothetical protein